MHVQYRTYYRKKFPAKIPIESFQFLLEKNPAEKKFTREKKVRYVITTRPSLTRLSGTSTQAALPVLTSR